MRWRELRHAFATTIVAMATVTVPALPALPATVNLTNAGAVRSKGFEVDATLAPVEGLTLPLPGGARVFVDDAYFRAENAPYAVSAIRSAAEILEADDGLAPAQRHPQAAAGQRAHKGLRCISTSR